MTKWLAAICAVLILGPPALAADEFKVEKLQDGPPADVLSAEVVAKLSPTGHKVVDERGKTVCEIWLTRQLDVNPDFEPMPTILYPLQSGSLAGALHFPRKGSDFRGQEIPSGVYTLRYSNQPEDGNHIGTFETRDFLLMLPAAADRDPKTLAGDDFFVTSAEAAESTHPAIIPLLKPGGGDAPAVYHIEEMEWWVLRLPASDAQGGKQTLELVVEGTAEE